MFTCFRKILLYNEFTFHNTSLRWVYHYYPISQIGKLRVRTLNLSKVTQLDKAGTALQTGTASVQTPPLPLTSRVPCLNLLICKMGMMLLIPPTLRMVPGI